MIGRYGRTVRASLNNKTLCWGIPMDWGRTVRPYLSSGKSAGNLFHLWNHVDYLSPAYHGNLRVFVCTQKARNTQNCDLFHSRSMRMKTFCEFCGFCVRYYFLVSRDGAKVAKVFINVITRIKLFLLVIRGYNTSRKSMNLTNNIRAICAICVQTTKIKWLLFESLLRGSRKNTIHLFFFFWTRITRITRIKILVIPVIRGEITSREGVKGAKFFYQRDYTD